MRKINKFLCLLFSAVFVLCILASFLLDGIYLTYASIVGVFALGFGVLWFVWSKKEKNKEQFIRDALESHRALDPLDLAMSYERDPHAVSGRRSRPGLVRPAEHELKRGCAARSFLFTEAGNLLPADIFSKVPITGRKT